MLYEAGINFNAQHPFPGFVVDAFDTDNNLAWEADGTYWHERRGATYERNRNRAIVKNGASYVVHLNEQDLAPWTARINQIEREARVA